MRDDILEKVKDSYQLKLQEMCYGTGEEVIDIVYSELKKDVPEDAGRNDITIYCMGMVAYMESAIETLKSDLCDEDARAVHKFTYSADAFRALAKEIERL